MSAKCPVNSKCKTPISNIRVRAFVSVIFQVRITVCLIEKETLHELY